jgi:predicted signal transduction protein with EAL and GGDEF domain
MPMFGSWRLGPAPRPASELALGPAGARRGGRRACRRTRHEPPLDALSDVGEAMSIARRLVAALAPPIDLEGRTISIRASFGIARCVDVSLTADELIRNADVAMYAAKAENPGSIALFDDGMLFDVRRRLDLREDLSHAIERGELAIAYQPLVDLELADDGRASACLEALSELGVRLAIDDFGSGQSSLARLQQLPVTEIKVDRTFLSTIDDSTQHATLVRSMIELGHALGLQMVAEGIERMGQLEVLRRLPCQVGQGYLFGRPQEAAAIGRLLAQEGPLRPIELATQEGGV